MRGQSTHAGVRPSRLLLRRVDVDRYHRQAILPGFGEAGQRRLLASHAVIVGCGALGCVIADALARAGVGTITLIDRDVVELSNLQRQVLYDERDAADGVPKAVAAARRLRAVNSAITVRPIVAEFAPDNAEDLAAGLPPPTVLLDGTDNFETRYLLNDVAVRRGIPFLYGGAVGTRGMQMTVIPGRTPCLRCVFPEPPEPGSAPTCDTTGVLAPAASIVASCQAADAIKLMLGRPDLVAPTLLDFDVWSNTRRRFDLSSHPRGGDCPCCGRGEFDFLRGRYAQDAVTLCGRGATRITPGRRSRVDLHALAARLAAQGRFVVNEHLLRGELDRERAERGGNVSITVFGDGRAIVRGVPTVEAARAIYARYVGA